MSIIFAICTPFKIFNPIVCFNAIDMVHDHVFMFAINERACHQSMHIMTFLFSSLRQHDIQISIRIYMLRQQTISLFAVHVTIVAD